MRFYHFRLVDCLAVRSFYLSTSHIFDEPLRMRVVPAALTKWAIPDRTPLFCFSAVTFSVHFLD